MVFKAPKFELKPRRVVEIPFRGTLAAGTMVTLNSGRITYPFRVTKVKMIFTDEANNQVIHSVHVLGNPYTSTTQAPTGDNLFGRESPTASFVGRSIIRVVPCNVEYPEGRRYIAFFTNNTSPYAYDFNGSVTIEEIG